MHVANERFQSNGGGGEGLRSKRNEHTSIETNDWTGKNIPGAAKPGESGISSYCGGEGRPRLTCGKGWTDEDT